MLLCDGEDEKRLIQLRLRDLLLLRHIEAHGTLRKVADALKVTQPAVTQALQVLERAFGVELVERSPRGVQLTSAGRAAASRLHAACNELSAAHAAALAPQSPLVRVGTAPMGAVDVLPEALARLRRSQPAVRVALTEIGVPQLWSSLADGTLDAIVASFPGATHGAVVPKGLACHCVGSERLVLVAPRSHRVAKHRPDLSTLAEQAWVLPPPGSLTMALFYEWFALGGLPSPVVGVTSASFLLNLRLAAACGMLTLAPESAVRRHAAVLKLKVVATPWEDKRGDIVFACRTSSLEQPAIEALRASFNGA